MENDFEKETKAELENINGQPNATPPKATDPDTKKDKDDKPKELTKVKSISANSDANVHITEFAHEMWTKLSDIDGTEKESDVRFKDNPVIEHLLRMMLASYKPADYYLLKFSPTYFGYPMSQMPFTLSPMIWQNAYAIESSTKDSGTWMIDMSAFGSTDKDVENAANHRRKKRNFSESLGTSQEAAIQIPYGNTLKGLLSNQQMAMDFLQNTYKKKPRADEDIFMIGKGSAFFHNFCNINSLDQIEKRLGGGSGRMGINGGARGVKYVALDLKHDFLRLEHSTYGNNEVAESVFVELQFMTDTLGKHFNGVDTKTERDIAQEMQKLYNNFILYAIGETKFTLPDIFKTFFSKNANSNYVMTTCDLAFKKMGMDYSNVGVSSDRFMLLFSMYIDLSNAFRQSFPDRIPHHEMARKTLLERCIIHSVQYHMIFELFHRHMGCRPNTADSNKLGDYLDTASICSLPFGTLFHTVMLPDWTKERSHMACRTRIYVPFSIKDGNGSTAVYQQLPVWICHAKWYKEMLEYNGGIPMLTTKVQNDYKLFTGKDLNFKNQKDAIMLLLVGFMGFLSLLNIDAKSKTGASMSKVSEYMWEDVMTNQHRKLTNGDDQVLETFYNRQAVYDLPFPKQQ